MYEYWKERTKTLFSGGMVIQVENLTDKLLSLISEFIKAPGFKVNVQKSKLHFYTLEISQRNYTEWEKVSSPKLHTTWFHLYILSGKITEMEKRLVVTRHGGVGVVTKGQHEGSLGGWRPSLSWLHQCQCPGIVSYNCWWIYSLKCSFKNSGNTKKKKKKAKELLYISFKSFNK